MENLNRLWRFFFAISLGALAVQQLIYGNFRPVILPPSFPPWLPGRLVWTWLFSVLLIAGCTAIILEIKARSVATILGGVLLLFVLSFHIPYQLSFTPTQLGVWTNALKALALSGGAFIVSESLPKERNNSAFTKILENLIPLGKYFLAVMMVIFGIDHFLYTSFVATFVPNWIPGHVFWTYFAGACLIAAGIAIILNIQRSTATKLLGVMLFLWLIILHLPRAIADPTSGDANEWTSVFEVMAFGGTAFLLYKKTDKDSQSVKKNNQQRLTAV
ncbi:MAG TPA: hypothetical protein VK671_05450 [Mucilaginibacter sp.]|jgi:uncharacterized membrane protein|nr:hypothetical protein [Mucilaginibacter sp.]